MCDVVFARKRTESRESKRDVHSKSSILEKFARTNRSIDVATVVPTGDRRKKADCSEPTTKVARSRAGAAGTSVGIFNNIRRSAFMHRSTAAPKEASKESVVDKVFVETDFFSDTPEKSRQGPEPCRSEDRSVKLVGSGPGTCSQDRGSNRSAENHAFEQSSITDSGKSSARNSAHHSRNGIIIESNHQAAIGKTDSDGHVDIDGLQARKALMKQVVAAWHADERCSADNREIELAAEAAAASEYRTCRKLTGLIASETFHDDMQELRDASFSAADARLCRSNLTRALQHSQHKILQSFVGVQEMRKQLEDEQLESTDNGCQSSAYDLEGQRFHTGWIEDEGDDRWCRDSGCEILDQQPEFESTNFASIDAVDTNFTLNDDNRCWVSERVQSENRKDSRDFFKADPYCTDRLPEGRRALNPRRFREATHTENTRQQRIRGERFHTNVEPAMPNTHSGRDPFPWLQGTARKLSKTDAWRDSSLGPGIDESQARDMCSSIEMGIISDSVTLPPELLSP